MPSVLAKLESLQRENDGFHSRLIDMRKQLQKADNHSKTTKAELKGEVRQRHALEKAVLRAEDEVVDLSRKLDAALRGNSIGSLELEQAKAEIEKYATGLEKQLAVETAERRSSLAQAERTEVQCKLLQNELQKCRDELVAARLSEGGQEQAVGMERKLREQAEAKSSRLESELFEALEKISQHGRSTKHASKQGAQDARHLARELAEAREVVKLEQRAVKRAAKQERQLGKAQSAASKRGVAYRAEADELRRALAEANAEVLSMAAMTEQASTAATRARVEERRLSQAMDSEARRAKFLESELAQSDIRCRTLEKQLQRLAKAHVADGCVEVLLAPAPSRRGSSRAGGSSRGAVLPGDEEDEGSPGTMTVGAGDVGRGREGRTMGVEDDKGEDDDGGAEAEVNFEPAAVRCARRRSNRVDNRYAPPKNTSVGAGAASVGGRSGARTTTPTMDRKRREARRRKKRQQQQQQQQQQQHEISPGLKSSPLHTISPRAGDPEPPADSDEDEDDAEIEAMKRKLARLKKGYNERLGTSLPPI